MTVYLSPEHLSGLGEDTFWTWFQREFSSSKVMLPNKLNDTDIVLRYSVLGPINTSGKAVALLWELLPEMKVKLHSNVWDDRIRKIMQCAKESQYRTIASPIMKEYYEEFGEVDVIPLGVNTDLFKPIVDKEMLRKKYSLPLDRKIGFWCGTTHPMKGFNKLCEWAKEHPEIYWIIVWKQKSETPNLYVQFKMRLEKRFRSYTHVSQQTLAELMNAADFFLVPGMLRPFFLVEWEAMACDLPPVIIGEQPKDFVPSNHPRNDIFRMKWDRKTARKTWEKYLTSKGVMM